MATRIAPMKPGDVIEIDGLVLERSADGKAGRAFRRDHAAHQVYSFLRRDQPSESTGASRFFARDVARGVAYVAPWHPWAGVRREVVAYLRDQDDAS